MLEAFHLTQILPRLQRGFAFLRGGVLPLSPMQMRALVSAEPCDLNEVDSQWFAESAANQACETQKPVLFLRLSG